MSIINYKLWILIHSLVTCVHVQSGIVRKGENGNNIEIGKSNIARDVYEKRTEHIVSGLVAPQYLFPYYAFLYINSSNVCGGSVIQTRWILTAAHCIVGSPPVMVIVGIGSKKKSNWQVFRRTQCIVHPKYRDLPHDIGLVKLLTTDIIFNDHVQPIALPRSNFKELDYPLLISGFGRLSAKSDQLPSKLQYLCTHTVPHSECRKMYPTRENEGIICSASAGRGTCNGDSGGPVVADNVVIGIVANTIDGCASKYPDIHTRVWTYMDWIKSYLEPWQTANPDRTKVHSCPVN